MPEAPFLPDDARLSPAALEFLRTDDGRTVREAIAALPDPAAPGVAEIAALRKIFPAEALHAALVIAALQPRAKRKFPHIPFVWTVPEALEQATDETVARHKAQRFAVVGPAHIFDLCAGIGGDALGLADVAPVTAVDMSRVRMDCLRFNGADASPPPAHAIATRAIDIRELLPELPADAWVHIDPSRRRSGPRGKQRLVRYLDSIPGPELIEAIFKKAAGGAIKLSPAMDFAELPESDGHLELISHHRSVVQAVFWRGALAAGFPAGTRTASVLIDGLLPFSFTAAPEPVHIPPAPALDAWLAPQPGATHITQATLYELDGAITRASLAAPFARQHQLVPLTVDGGYLFSTDADAPRNPALGAFTLRAITRFSESRVAAMLNALPPAAAGAVEVKSRGSLPGIDTDRLQKSWSAGSPFVRTVLLFSYRGDTLAAAADRLPR